MTYDRPAHATSAVETPEVASAMPARARRPTRGSEEVVSRMKKKGESVKVRVSEPREKILSRRKVVVSGPW